MVPTGRAGLTEQSTSLVLVAYTGFVETTRGGFTLPMRDWRLITLVAAKHIPSTYCSLVYGKGLLGDLGSPEAVLAVQRDSRRAGLPDRDVVMLEYAEKVTNDAPSIDQHDIDWLREHGFSDEQIADIALCAAFRNFISRFFDAVGGMPDDEYRSLDLAFREPLCVGRLFPERADRDRKGCRAGVLRMGADVPCPSCAPQSPAGDLR
jgi:uncharacterized peroxidase-related enzyme